MSPIRMDHLAKRDGLAWAILCAFLLAAGTGCSTEPSPTPADDDDDQTADDDSDDDDDDDAPADDDQPADDDGDDDSKPSPVKKPDASTSGGGKDSGTVAPPDDKGQGSDAGAAPSNGELTWCTVKPLIEKHCTSCHDSDGSGGSPMSLLTAADFAKMAPITTGKTVAEQSKVRINATTKPMPPRGGVPAADIKTLTDWLSAGAPAGSGDCAPTTGGSGGEGRVDGWDESKCDEVYEVRSHAASGKDTPYTVPPGQEIHPQIRLDAPWGSEKVQAIGFQPITDNKKVLHHWILNGFGRSFLAGWAPGDEGRPPFPDDVGMDMPSGANAFTLDMHYFNTGAGAKPEQDRSGVKICVLKEGHFRPKLAAVTGSLASIGRGGVLAPRQTARYDATSVCNVTSTQPVHILTAAPHAHKYAIHMKFTVKKKSGQEIVMHDQPWIFGEQGTYAVPGGDVVVEAGDTITTICSYKNDTNQDIRFGESTESEMCFNFALYYPKGALRCGSGGLGALGF